MEKDQITARIGPMEGIMHAPFLHAVGTHHLADHLITAFLRISDHVPKAARIRDFLAPYLAANVPVTLQLMGTDAKLLAESARIASDMGVAGIDFNFGCPSKQVVSGGAGGGALRNADNMRGILIETRSLLPDHLPVTAKVRTGFASPDEMDTILPMLCATGALSGLAVHFRTVREGYLPVSGRSERLRHACELAAPLPVTLNGDIDTADDAWTLLRSCGGAGVMAARGFLRDPWLLRRIRGKESPDVTSGRIQFYRTALRHGQWTLGNAIELARWSFGNDSTIFRALIGGKELQEKEICAILYDMEQNHSQ